VSANAAPLPAATAAAFVGAGPGSFRLQGPLTFDSVPALRPLGLQLLGEAGAGLVIDLQGVPIADSAGLALLIDWLAMARAHGSTLRYVGVPETLLALAELSEVGALINA
jgi:phospholipid transport system transporter-binding protein